MAGKYKNDRALLSRRRFMERTAIAMAAPKVIASTVLAGTRRPPPSDRITLGFVGLGGQGTHNLRAFLAEPAAQVIAVCDVDRLHYRDQPWGQGSAMGREPAMQIVDEFYQRQTGRGQGRNCAGYVDFREMCGRDDIDAVVISTPDHWHALVALEAIEQGKDVYGEKPLVHLFAEGQKLCRAVSQHNRVFQTGSQQRSMPLFQQAVELVLNGHLGTIQRVEVGLPDGYDEPQEDPTVLEPPEGLDYSLWCGPSPKLPYMRARHHRWWRGHRVFGGGTLMDWIGHHHDIAQWSLGQDHGGPQRVMARNWVFPKTDIYNTPVHFEIECQYPQGTVVSISDRHEMGVKWIGTSGWLYANRGKLEASESRWLNANFDRGAIKVPAASNHFRNFLDCVRSRESCLAPPEVALRSITPGFLGYASQAVGRPIQWNAKQQVIVGDSGAAEILSAIEYQAPWRL